MAASDVYAHSVDGQPSSEWEPLSDHLAAVGNRAAAFADAFGCGPVARAAGQLHDIGKCSEQFQSYIAGTPTGSRRGGDHSTAGAREACTAYPGPLGRMLAYVIAGHHGGLGDWTDVAPRLGVDHAIPPYAGWQTQTGVLPASSALGGPQRSNPDKGFTSAFLIRMVFSCLVDADFLETERFLAQARDEPVARGGYTDLAILHDRLRGHMGRMRSAAAASPVNEIRNKVLDHVITRAGEPPGLFTLTVPTGGGKTLASLSFAMEHARHHGMRRIVYVIPYTSIIEQTAAVFRVALATQDDVLEHHASFDWDHETDEEGRDGVAKLRHAAENWDVPVVVTTAVQFFESLFANRTSRCRKLHNLAGAVIVLDEAQTLPLHLLRPCMAVLDELARNYRASVVLCTATQPALRRIDGFGHGFEIDHERELAPEPALLYGKLRRVRVERLEESAGDAEIAARFAEKSRMLCIVNSRAHAHALFTAIRDLPGATHLTTLMCPRHRRAVLARLRAQLAAEDVPVRLVATSLIEAGVDIDFPEVWRAEAGLDAIAQAAGRCNREGRLALGRTVVFTPADAKPPRALEAFAQAARAVMRQHDDPLTLEAVRDYFQHVYWQKGEAALDGTMVGAHRGILPAIAERAREVAFPFFGIAEAFRMIDEAMEPVIVPWQAGPDDHAAATLLARIAAMDRPLIRDLRQLQQYAVPIPRARRDDWLARGVLQPVHPRLNPALLRLGDLAHYDDLTGLDIGAPSYRAAESNVM
jgi:CRISPR-associated endonuclease/helicase Cas3